MPVRSFTLRNSVWLKKSLHPTSHHMSSAPRPATAAPGVSAALARRIASHLASGQQPSINGRRVALRDVVLVRANGSEAPAAEEVRRQAAASGIPMDISFWDCNAAVERQGNRSYGFDIEGNKHLISQARRGQRVVTATGRRFYEEIPQTEWITHVPPYIVETTAAGVSRTSGPILWT